MKKKIEKRKKKNGQRYLRSVKKRRGGRKREKEGVRGRKKAAHAHVSEAMSTHEFISTN